MRNIYIWLLATGLCTPGIGFAESDSATVMDLQSAIEYGLRHSIPARLSRTEEDIAGTQIGQAASLVLPQFSVDASYTRLDRVTEIDLGEGPFALGSADNYEVRAGVSQLLYSGGQVGAALRAAQLARDFAGARRNATEALLARDITTQFYGLMLAEEIVQVQQESLALLRAFEAQTRQRSGSGAASDFEELTARVRVANAMPELLQARNQLALAQEAFRTLLYHPGPIAVTGSLDVADIQLELPEIQAMALANRNELHSSEILIGLAHESIANARSEAYPSIRLFANYIGANPDQFSFEDDWEWRWNAGVTLRWNLWDGNLTRQTVRQKQLEWQQRRHEYDERREAILLEVRQAWLSLQHARERLAASAESVVLAERALDIARTRYEAGLSTYLELTDANLARSTARLMRLQAQHDLAVAIANVQYAAAWQPPIQQPIHSEDHPPQESAQEEDAQEEHP